MPARHALEHPGHPFPGLLRRTSGRRSVPAGGPLGSETTARAVQSSIAVRAAPCVTDNRNGRLVCSAASNAEDGIASRLPQGWGEALAPRLLTRKPAISAPFREGEPCVPNVSAERLGRRGMPAVHFPYSRRTGTHGAIMSSQQNALQGRCPRHPANRLSRTPYPPPLLSCLARIASMIVSITRSAKAKIFSGGAAARPT